MNSKTVLINGMDFVLKKVRRSKSLKITIHQDKRVVVTAPYYTSYKTMERFLGLQEEWIKSIVPADISGSYKKNKEKARVFVHSRLEYFNQFYKFPYNRVSIRNQKTRWGSCSRKGNLNFNYKIIFLSPEAADYIIVHELCHLKELNHSKGFWDLVEKAIPNYKAIRKQLKQNIA